MTVERDRGRRQQVERLERRRRLLEVHSNSGHIVLNGRIVARRVRVGVRPPHRRRGMPLQASIGPTRCQTHDLWDELGRQIQFFLQRITLADVVAGRVLGRAVPLDSGQSLAAE